MPGSGIGGVGVVGGVGGIGGIGGMDLARLAQRYREQVLSGTAESGTSATATIGAGTTGATTIGGADPAAATRGSDFARTIGNGLAEVENLDRTAATKATQAATGDLRDVHDYVIAATQAQVATELTTTVRNKALDAFNEIIRMPL
jgi:flagellar hook-basal body complex protein FliE